MTIEVHRQYYGNCGKNSENPSLKISSFFQILTTLYVKILLWKFLLFWNAFERITLILMVVYYGYLS